MLDRRGAVHAGDDGVPDARRRRRLGGSGCWRRICRPRRSRTPRPASTKTERVAALPRHLRAQVLRRRGARRHAAGRRADPPAWSSSAAEPARDLPPAGPVRLHLLPQRDDLLRSRRPAAGRSRGWRHGWRRAGICSSSHSESLNNLRHGLTWIAPSVLPPGPADERAPSAPTGTGRPAIQVVGIGEMAVAERRRADRDARDGQLHRRLRLRPAGGGCAGCCTSCCRIRASTRRGRASSRRRSPIPASRCCSRRRTSTA